MVLLRRSFGELADLGWDLQGSGFAWRMAVEGQVGKLPEAEEGTCHYFQHNTATPPTVNHCNNI